MTNFKAAALAAALVCCTAGAQAASILDTFSDGAMLIKSDTPPYVEAYTASAQAPGGGRYIAAGVAQAGKFTFSTTPVPEPETVSLMLAGQALLGSLAPRRA